MVHDRYVHSRTQCLLALQLIAVGCGEPPPSAHPELALQPTGWSVVAEPAGVEPPAAASGFVHEDVGPIYAAVATARDGRWQKVVDPRHPADETRLLQTVLHPDPRRAWSVVTVIAADLSRLRLHAAAGRLQSKGKTSTASQVERRALVPPEHHDGLVVAFNGAQESSFGGYGMKVDGVVLSPARADACAVARYDDGRVAIAPWRFLEPHAAALTWWRQTPVCLFHQRYPSAAIDASGGPYAVGPMVPAAVVFRSAIGLDQEHQVLFLALGEHTTLPAMALALHHVGVSSAAPLDLGHGRVRLVTFDVAIDGQGLRAVPLTTDPTCARDEYIGTPAARDFFYLTRHPPRRSGGG